MATLTACRCDQCGTVYEPRAPGQQRWQTRITRGIFEISPAGTFDQRPPETVNRHDLCSPECVVLTVQDFLKPRGPTA